MRGYPAISATSSWRRVTGFLLPHTTISESGSGNGVKSLINKACNIANLSRFMKDSEFKSCVANGVLPVAHVVAFDGLAVIVNPKNKIVLAINHHLCQAVFFTFSVRLK